MVGIGDVLVSPVQFGVADEVNSTTGYSIGLMGIGYASNEAVQSRRDFYPNMPEVLKDAGEINSRLYSVYLNDESECIIVVKSQVHQLTLCRINIWYNPFWRNR